MRLASSITGRFVSIRRSPGAGQRGPGGCLWHSVRNACDSGRLLTANDLSEEQQYHVAKHRRHLHTLHGAGIVSGLDVQVSPGGATITVSPGLAIDEQG
jgi:hypothetical protein